MANWQRTLDVRDVWDSEDVSLIARTAADRLEALKPFTEYNVEDTRLNLVEELRALAEDPDATTQDFDYVWDAVYDWGDTNLDDNLHGKKVCWIKTL